MLPEQRRVVDDTHALRETCVPFSWIFSNSSLIERMKLVDELTRISKREEKQENEGTYQLNNRWSENQRTQDLLNFLSIWTNKNLKICQLKEARNISVYLKNRRLVNSLSVNWPFGISSRATHRNQL